MDNTVLLSQEKELRQYYDTVSDILFQLKNYKSNLMSSWQASEAAMLENAIDETSVKLIRINRQIEDLQRDFLQIYQEYEEKNALVEEESEQ